MSIHESDTQELKRLNRAVDETKERLQEAERQFTTAQGIVEAAEEAYAEAVKYRDQHLNNMNEKLKNLK